MHTTAQSTISKVPEVTLAFWVIKIAATTLGETGGDAVSMSLHLGYAVGTFIFFPFFFIIVAAQMMVRRFHPWLYWTVIVATTLTGTTMADFADRSLGIGYVGGTSLLFVCVLLVLAAWRLTLGSVSVSTITTRQAEAFYWLTILFSNTLGTALGDLISSDTVAGFAGGALIFSALLAVLGVLYFCTNLSHTLLFWAAFILTRPLGATLGDLLTKPVAEGGFHLSRIDSTSIIAVFIAACILVLPQRAGRHPGQIAPGA